MIIFQILTFQYKFIFLLQA